jgi:tetratricopeptide (TPR) repeat protein
MSEPPAPVATLVERLAGEMAARWRGGERPLTEEFLARHPELHDQPEAVAELVYEEICLHQEFGEDVSAASLRDRFPRWRDQLEVILACHQLLEADAGPPRFPAAGESLDDTHLLAELGRGAWGRVFLATQPRLADRPLVLKLVPRGAQEHLALARLQHTHIVPLYFVRDDPARNLCLLAMPYFGGATLAQLLEWLRDVPPARRTGKHLLQALQAIQAAAHLALPVAGPACRFLARASYVQAVCWIGACLADALHYAHERSLIHLDVKPSNVLLAADGQPMLLDFHLARSPIAAGCMPPESVGGTPVYMAPEQQAALKAVRAAHRVPSALDGRADLFALGLVLEEALQGTLAVPGSRPPRRNPRVTPGLADLLRKCRASDPCERYPTGAALAADLRRHLADLPLKDVVNRSVAERWQKWRRRRPYALHLLAAVAILLAAGWGAFMHVSHQLNRAEAALAEGSELFLQGHFVEAHGALERGRALAEDMPFSRGLQGELALQLRRTKRMQVSEDLNHLVERVRAFHGAEVPAARDLEVLEAHCRTLWQQRHRILQHLGPNSEGEWDPRVRTDLLDLAVLWSDLRVRRANLVEVRTARREALDVLAEAERLLGPSAVLYRERRVHAEALGMAKVAREAARLAATLPPRTAWEHYAFGRSLFEAGELEAAIAELDQALDLQPRALWTNVLRGRCAFHLGHPEEAALAFTACITLAPENAGFFYNRGLAYAQWGRLDLALRDYDHALRLDPHLGSAALNRGLLHHEAQRYALARTDLERARALGVDPATVHYNLALVYLAKANRAAAAASVREALEYNPDHREARQLQEQLEAER